jgi:hypothetical protein
LTPLVLSYSALNTYRRCPKNFELSYERRIIPRKHSEAADLGTALHEILAGAARDASVENHLRAASPEQLDGMFLVASAYLKHKPIPREVIAIEEPYYTRLIRGVWLRTTFDLVYRDESGWVVGRDYKSFEKAPALDVDLDFQGGIYVAALQRAFPDAIGHRFEYEYIRRVPPGTKNSTGVWRPDECYINVPVVQPRRELDVLWAETQEWARTILRARMRGSFPRAGTRKEFGSPCLGCFQLDLCKAEMQHGTLDDQDMEFFAEGIGEVPTLPATLLAPSKRTLKKEVNV